MPALTSSAVRVEKPGQWRFLDREIPDPASGQVRIKVAACGVCHGDAVVAFGAWPGLTLPRVPGHEVAGLIEALGPGVTGWKVGDRVGVGWAGQSCGVCVQCRRGETIHCRTLEITGVHFDGGYAQHMLAPVESLAHVPDGMNLDEAAPLMCAGMTSFNALRHSSARAGDTVAIHGLGGVGHLALQFARKMGFKTIALSQGRAKESLALELGAHGYIDTVGQSPAQELQKLGGAKLILTTAPNGAAMSAVVGGLAVGGELMVVGAALDALSIPGLQLLMGHVTVRGWSSGSPLDAEDTLRFCALQDIHPLIELFPLDQAESAFQSMLTNKARFRAVIKPA